MAIFNSLDTAEPLSELDRPLIGAAEGTISAATRKARALANLGVTATAAELNILDGVTATAAEINAAADVTTRVISVPDATPYTVLAANSGKVHVLPNFTATTTINLPAASAGLEYEFISSAVAADAQNWIFAAQDEYLGGLQFVDTDEPASPALLTSVFPNGTTNDNMTIVTPGAGTYIRVVCNGTNWVVNGVVYSATVPTFAD